MPKIAHSVCDPTTHHTRISYKLSLTASLRVHRNSSDIMYTTATDEEGSVLIDILCLQLPSLDHSDTHDF